MCGYGASVGKVRIISTSTSALSHFEHPHFTRGQPPSPIWSYQFLRLFGSLIWFYQFSAYLWSDRRYDDMSLKSIVTASYAKQINLGHYTIIGRQSEGSIIRGFVNQKWVPYSQRYLFNAIPDTNHNANPTNPNRYSKGNPNPNTRYRIIEPSDYWTLGLSIHYPLYITAQSIILRGNKRNWKRFTCKDRLHSIIFPALIISRNWALASRNLLESVRLTEPNYNLSFTFETSNLAVLAVIHITQYIIISQQRNEQTLENIQQILTKWFSRKQKQHKQ